MIIIFIITWKLKLKTLGIDEINVVDEYDTNTI